MSLEAAPHVSPSQPVKIQVTLNHIDYAVTKPGPLDNSDLPVVPVIRIYGNSSTGQKTCLHVHQVFPYFYIDYPGSLKPKDGKQILRLANPTLIIIQSDGTPVLCSNHSTMQLQSPSKGTLRAPRLATSAL